MDLTVQQLKEKMESGDIPVLVDVREPWENDDFNIGGILVPVGELANRMWELEPYKDQEIVMYCRSGRRSATAQAMMQSQGFVQVRNLTGGMLAWEDAFGRVKP